MRLQWLSFVKNTSQRMLPMKICCPECGSTKSKKNGHIHNGKQNHFSGSDDPETPNLQSMWTSVCREFQAETHISRRKGTDPKIASGTNIAERNMSGYGSQPSLAIRFHGIRVPGVSGRLP